MQYLSFADNPLIRFCATLEKLEIIISKLISKIMMEYWLRRLVLLYMLRAMIKA
jgi:hypothetical protein